jgi:hypothetical protein
MAPSEHLGAPRSSGRQHDRRAGVLEQSDATIVIERGFIGRTDALGNVIRGIC